MNHYRVERINRDGHIRPPRRANPQQTATARTLSTSNPVGLTVITCDDVWSPDTTACEVW